MSNGQVFGLILALSIMAFILGAVIGVSSDQKANCPVPTAEPPKHIETVTETATCDCPKCENPCAKDDQVQLLESILEESKPNSGAQGKTDEERLQRLKSSGTQSAESVLDGLNSSDINLQDTACHYANDFPDDRYIEPLLKILHSPDITKPLPKDHRWSNNYLAYGCMNALVSQWYLDGTSEATWNATIDYLKTVSLDQVPHENMTYGIFSKLTDTISERDEDWLSKATYYKPDVLAEALITYIHNGLAFLNKHKDYVKHLKSNHVDKYQFLVNACFAIATHAPEYLKYLFIDPTIPDEFKSLNLIILYKHDKKDDEKSEPIKKDACNFLNKIKQREKFDDPIVTKLGLPEMIENPKDYMDILESASEPDYLGCSF